MRIGFAGTPAFAASVLRAMIAARFDISLVLTRPDRRQGRALKLAPPPVKELAIEHSLPVLQPVTLRSDEACAELTAVALDLLVVVAYGLLLPRSVLSWPRLGCINVHASLLPRWRGAAPIARALLAGDGETGISLMQMDAGLDTGPILHSSPVAIEPRETAGTLHDKLAQTGAHSIVRLLQRLAGGETIDAIPQSHDGVTYAAKIETADTLVAWDSDAAIVDRQIRAFNPAPGAMTRLRGNVIKLWAAQPCAAHASRNVAGTVLAASRKAIVVACGSGALELTELQPAGRPSMSAAAFIAGRRIVAGDRFD